MLYRLSEFENYHGYVLTCTDLSIDTHGFWAAGAILMNLPLDKFVEKLVNEYDAKIVPIIKCGKLEWFWYYWEKHDIASCRKFKNHINSLARRENFQI